MPIQDRSVEFRSCVESIRTRSVAPAKQKLIHKRSGETIQKSEFTRSSEVIGKAIWATALKLNKLAQRTCPPRIVSALPFGPVRVIRDLRCTTHPGFFSSIFLSRLVSPIPSGVLRDSSTHPPSE